MSEFKYAMVNRPVGIGTAPKGVVRTEDRPKPNEAHYDMARNGVAVYDRKLTHEETKSFEMAHMVADDEMSEYVDVVVNALVVYANGYYEMACNKPDDFYRQVFEKLKSNVMGYVPSIADKDAFVALVKQGLRLYSVNMI